MLLESGGEGAKKEGTLKFRVPVDSDNGIVTSQVTKNFISSHWQLIASTSYSDLACFSTFYCSTIHCIHYSSLSAIFNLLHSSTNRELFEKHLCNQNSHYEKCERFLLRREAITCYRQIGIFTVSKDEWTQRRILVSP